MIKQKVSKYLIGIYIFSLAFYQKEVFLGYDSPWVYAGLFCLLFSIIFKSDENIYIPKVFFYWFFFMFLIVLSSITSFYPEKVLFTLIRYGVVITISFGLYQLLTIYSEGVKDFLRFQIWLSIILSILAIAQIIEFNLKHSHFLYFPPTNLTYILSGTSGAVVRGLNIYRATGTFAEPSHFAYYLLPVLVLTIVKYFQSKQKKDLLVFLIIAMGWLSTISFSNLLIGIVIIPIFLTNKFIYEKHKLKMIQLFFGIILFFVIVIIFIKNYFPQYFDYILNRSSLIFSKNDPSLIQRLYTIQDAILLFKKNIIFGIGAGNYNITSRLILGKVADVSIDSGFILILVELGLLGFIIFGFIFYISIRSTLKNKSALGEQLYWLLLTQLFILLFSNYWCSPFLWANLAAAFVVNKYNKGM